MSKRDPFRELSVMRLGYLRSIANDLLADAELVAGTAAEAFLRGAAGVYRKAYRQAKRKARIR